MMANPATLAAAAGLGRPRKFMWSSSSLVSTLNRASRSDAQTAYEAAITHTASLWKNENCGHIFTSRNAGATPKDTMSQRLSNSAPNSLADFASRAM